MKSIFTTRMFKNLSFTLLAFLSVLVSSAQTTFNYTGGMQTYTVPPGVTSISIDVFGAQGGAGGTALAGGLGANMYGEFIVTPGQVLNILVGQQGEGTNATAGAGGGGGSFVTDALNNPLIIAGGGGGVHGTLITVGVHANSSTNGNDGYSDVSSPPFPGLDGFGGSGGNGATGNNPHAGNGGGFYTSGDNGQCGGPGQSFLLGGAGGSGCGTFGGFGGGGGGGNNGGGGGGGYSGGGGSYHTPTNGGGGGSFNSGANQNNLAGVRSGNGQVIITELVSCVPTFLNPVGALPDLTGECSVAAPVAPTTTNDCGDVVTGTTVTSFPITTQGTTVVTWNFDDGQGNTATQTQNVIVDDVTPPVPGYGTGTLADPFTTTSASVLAAYPSGLFYFNLNGTAFLANVENTINGGGWILVLNYVHQGGTNPALNVRSTDLPIQTGAALGTDESGSAAWGHASNALLNTLNPTELMFYGQTSAHGRIINFTTNLANGLSYVKTGVGDFNGINNPVNHTLLGGHTAFIPQNATSTWSNMGDGALTDFPYWLSATYHWGIRGAGNRWEVDDFPNNEANSTIHRVWGRNTNPPTTQPIPTITDVCSVTPPTPTATDNCAGVVNGVPDVSFPITAQGTTTITWTYDDGNGNTSTQTQNVVLSDITAPVITCPANISVNNDAGVCGALVNFTLPTATDNCGAGAANILFVSDNGDATEIPTALTSAGYTVTSVFNDFVAGNNTVLQGSLAAYDLIYWHASGANGFGEIHNTATFTNLNSFVSAGGNVFVTGYDVMVSPNDPDMITFLGGTFGNDIGPGNSTLIGPNSLTSGFANIVGMSIIAPNFDQDNVNGLLPGTTMVLQGSSGTGSEWNLYSPGGGEIAWVSSGQINGSAFPSWTTLGSGYHEALLNFAFNSSGAGALVTQTDLSGLTSGSTFPVGTTTLEYTATDGSGNTDVCTFTVTVTDNQAPTITCPANISVNNDPTLCSAVVTYTAPIGTDNCSGAATAQTVGLASGATFPVGATTNTFVVTAANGQTANCSFTVTVTDNEAPNAICQNVTVNLNAAGNGSTTAAAVNNVSTDNCGIASLSLSQTAFTCANVGPNTVTLTVTDNALIPNVSTCTATVTVVDAIAPTAICQNVTVNLDATGNGSTTAAAVNNASTDACGIASLSLSQTAFTCANVGSNTVTLTVTDVNTNSSTCIATVNVVDLVPPTAICQNINSNLDASGNVTVLASEINLGSNDACGIASLQINGSASQLYTCSNIGANTATLTVIDNNSNSSTCTATITVQDLVPPTALCNTPLTIALNPSGNASVTVSDINNGSFDNCGLAGLSVAPNNFTCANIGANSVVLTVLDNNGLSSTCTSTINIIDNINPVALCATPVNVSLDVTGNASITPAMVNLGSTDNCGISTFAVIPNTFTCANTGLNPLTLTVTDASGNSASCVSQINIQDLVAPVAVCQPVTLTLDITGNASLSAPVDLDGGSTDNCALVPGLFTASQSVFNCSDLGANNITLTVFDVAGNSATCTSVVTVQDLIAPIAICQPFTVVLDASGNASITAANINNGSSDACGVAISASQTTFTCANVGSNNVTLTATDPSGNSSTCVAVVTVEDNSIPVVVCPSNITQNAILNNCGKIVTYSVGVTDNCATTTQTDLSGLSSGSLFPVGVTTQTYDITDAGGNTVTCSFTVTIVDIQDPTITGCPANIVVSNDPNNCNANVFWTAPTASDNCSGVVLTTTILPGSNFPVGTTPVTYTATDASGRTTTCTFSVTVQDTQLPTITCPAAIAVNTDPGVCFATVASLGTPVTADNCGVLSVTNDAPLTFPVGPTTVTWTVTDIHSNVQTCTQIVTVTDNVNPIALCQNVTVNLDVTGNGSTTAALVNNGSSDACGIASLVLSDTDFTCADVATSPNVVTLTVTDVNGNVSTCTADVTVIDNIAPVAVCVPFTVSLDAAGTASITTANIDGGSGDACGVTLSASPTAFTCANLGANTVTLTVTDANGNVSTCTSTVTVVDAIAPIIACQNMTVQLNAAGTATITAGDVTASATDNCTITSSTIDISTFNCTNVGTPVTVTLTVTDQSSNASTCTSTITVEDNVAPVALCQNVTVNLDVTGNGSTTAALVNNGSSDACGIASLVLSDTDFTCADVATSPNTVTLTVTDVNGNVSTCTADVTVIDNIAPVAVCQNISINLDATGNATITAADINSGSSDACGVTLAASQTAFTCANVGANSVVLTVTDPSGNFTTCTSTVTVVDVTAPVAVCQDIVVQLDATGNATVTGAMINNGSSDACGIATLAVLPNTFTCANIGANAVVLTVTDVNGNASTCNATVTIQDNVAPVALCQNVTVILDVAGNGSTSAAAVDNGSSDACGIASITLSQTTFDCSEVGVNTVTLTVVDVNGNSSTCTADVTVIDNIAPVAVCQDITVQLDAAGQVTIVPADIDGGSSDACTPIALSFANTSIFGFTGIFDPSNWTFNANGSDATYSFGGTTSVTITGSNSGNGANAAVLCSSVPENGTIIFDWSFVTSDTDGAFYDPFGYNLNGVFNVLTNSSGPDFQSGSASIVVSAGDQFCFNQSSTDGAFGSATTVSSLFIFTADGSQMTFDCSEVGVNVVPLYVTDPSGNVSTCNANVTVEDNIAPIIACQDITVQLNASGNVSIVPADITASATDNCAIATSTIDVSAFTCANVGPNTVTLTVTDVNGNVSTCTANVTVQDNVAPVALCQNVTVTLDVLGDGSTSAAAVNNSSTDACGIASLALSQTAFDCSHVGANTVTLTVVDVNGNSSTCSAVVTVIDNIAPNAVCQNITVSLDGTGNASIVAADIDGGSTDACGIATYVASQTAFTCANVGPNNVTLTLTDVNGNISSCVAVVTVIDPIAPVITCPGNVLVSNDPGLCTASNVAYGTATATDNCSSVVITNNAPLVFPFGVTNITWTATDIYGNTAVCIQTVTVEDVENPIVTCPADLTVSADAGVCDATGVVLGTATATDNCTLATILSDAPATFPLGTTMVTWTATDVQGNSSNCTQFVTVVDTEAPAITCPANITVPALFGSCEAVGVVLGTPTTTDNCSVASVTNNGLVNYPLGTTIVTWTVTDAAGNTSTCNQTVTVTDTQLPTIACPTNVTVPADLTLCSATGVVLGTPVTTDNCSIASVTNNAPATFGLGNTIVTWTVVDGSSNTATCTQTITVIDTQLPTIACPTAVTVAADLGSCTATAVLLGTAATNDNCSIASTSNNAPLAFPLGATTVTWTVVDGSGNTATCTQTVTVIDTEFPTITCPTNVSVVADLGICTASSVALGTPTTADNCSVASVTNNAPATFPLGTTTVTWTVVDGSGNTSTCTQTVTVTDTQLPTIACPTNVTVPADFGTCTAIAVVLGTPTTADNCSVASTTNNAPAIFPLGNTMVTWTVVDGSGNTATCMQTITVIDTQVPTITCPVAVTVPADLGVCTSSGVVLGSPITNDNCSVASVTNNALATYPLGNTLVTWTVVDGSGNVSTCSQTVTVVDTQSPIVTCPAAITVPADLGSCTATGVVLGTPSVVENCSVASVTNNAPAVYPLGVTTVIWTVVDGSGNTTFCTQFVTVTDTQMPTIACAADVTVPAGAGTCVATGVVLTAPTTADNCSVATVTNNAPAVYPLGNTTVTWTVTDGSGNTATCTQVVTVIDTQLPTIACPANVVIASNAGTCVATGVVLGTPVTTDNCSVASVTNNAPSTFPLGTTNVTWTVVDGSGNIQTCVQTVTVEDTQAPTIVCPSDVTVSAAGGTCSATTVALGTPTTADNCSVASVTNNAPSIFPLGATVVTWTVVDGSGNLSTCTQTVTVVDNQNPIIACPFPVAVTTDLGSCDATGVALGTPTTADNCSVASVTNNAPVAFGIGTTTVVWTVTDGSGNTATCTQTVTVTDIELPTITCPADVTVAAAIGSCSATGVVLGSPITADNCTVASVTNDAPSVYGLGTTTVTWTVVDGSGNVSTCTQTVTVTDTQLPTIACPANVTVAADLGSCLASGVVLGTPATTDNCSVASVTNNAPASYPLGNTTVTWTVVDGSGNTATCTQVVTVIDTQLPTIVCAAPLTVNTDAGVCEANFTLTAPATADNCSVASVTSNAPATFPLGTTVVTWTVVDGSGNTATCTQTVTVEDNELPTIACQSDITLNNLPGFCGRSVNYATPVFGDNCTVASFTQTDASGYVSGDLFPIGTTYQEFTVVDNSGNTFTCGFNITIVDNELPVMSNCPSDIVAFINEPGLCEQNVSWQNPTASDNCPGIDLTQNYFPGSSFPIGTTVVTYTATDNAGNSVSCSFSVTVIDQADPIVTVVNETKLTVNVSGASYQWVDCDNNYAPIAGATTQTFSPTTNGNYAVIVNTGGCPDTSNCETVSVIGIEEITYSEIVLYPNPSYNGSFMISYDGTIEAIMVYDMTGREVGVDVDLNTKSVNGSELASGKYMVRILTDNQLITKELVVVKGE